MDRAREETINDDLVIPTRHPPSPMTAAAVPLLIIGPILLFGALGGRREFQTKVRLIDQRLAQLKRDELGPPVRNDRRPEKDEVPPPPPMRPPGSELTPPVEPQVLLATF